MNRREVLRLGALGSVWLLPHRARASSIIMWNQPNVAPYKGGNELAFDKMSDLMPERVADYLLAKVKAAQGTRTKLVPGLQLTAMMSGKDRLLPNVVVGDWARTRPDLPNGAWMFHVHNEDTDYYVVVPDVCGNISLIVMVGGVCVPNPNACDCDAYVRQYVS